MPRLRAVLFDIDDTLYSTTEFAQRARANAVRAMVEAGLGLPEEVVARELDEVIAEFSSNYDHHFDKLLQRLRPAALERINPAVVVAAGVAAYHDTKFRELKPFPDVVPLLRTLRSAGVGRGIVSHGWTVKQAEKIVRLGLLPYLDLDAIFISDQIGIAKPNPKLYQTALRDLGLQASDVLYVGDHPAHDVGPPKALGMRTAWCRRSTKWKLQPDEPQPDHVLDDFEELGAILRERYGVEG
ncbi:MAG TPA: TIGR02253 family HAD-type hydrolase [Planctomycetota bacterium]|nr:TIGR02253 family HAD-type hydrolase [Planctomycetota bacterium]